MKSIQQKTIGSSRVLELKAIGVARVDWNVL